MRALSPVASFLARNIPSQRKRGVADWKSFCPCAGSSSPSWTVSSTAPTNQRDEFKYNIAAVFSYLSSPSLKPKKSESEYSCRPQVKTVQEGLMSVFLHTDANSWLAQQSLPVPYEVHSLHTHQWGYNIEQTTTTVTPCTPSSTFKKYTTQRYLMQIRH